MRHPSKVGMFCKRNNGNAKRIAHACANKDPKKTARMGFAPRGQKVRVLVYLDYLSGHGICHKGNTPLKIVERKFGCLGTPSRKFVVVPEEIFLTIHHAGVSTLIKQRFAT